METITAIRPDERLVASGVYHYQLGAIDTGVREAWEMRARSDGHTITRIERQANVYQSTLLVEITQQNTRIQNFEVVWKNGMEGNVADAYAHYSVSDTLLQVRRVVNGHETVSEQGVDAKLIVAPLMRICIGQVIRQLLDYPDGAQVLVPNIKDPTNAETLLAPHFERRSARLIATEPLTIGTQLYQAKRYQYTGELYDTDAQFWLDKQDVLLRYTWKQADGLAWDVQLNDYLRR